LGRRMGAAPAGVGAGCAGFVVVLDADNAVPGCGVSAGSLPPGIEGTAPFGGASGRAPFAAVAEGAGEGAAGEGSAPADAPDASGILPVELVSGGTAGLDPRGNDGARGVWLDRG
jgi:hypothetical protein